MKVLSLFSGIEGPTLAARSAGFEPIAFAEIEKFPSAVLAERFPGVPNLGDVTKFREWPDLGTVDVVCGGSPCQDYSVAGKRLGMAGDRGQLTLAYIEIIARYRPRWVVFENVPGLLSSNAGRDFARFLGDISGQGIEPPGDGWQRSGIVAGISAAYGGAWRMLDAQFVRTRNFPRAVPQRRRRLFFVGYRGDWRPAAAVLFDRESLRRDPPPRREARQVAPAGAGTGVALRGRDGGSTAELTGPVPSALRTAGGGSDKARALVARSLRGEGFDASEDGTGRGTPIVPVEPPLAFGGNNTAGPIDVAPACIAHGTRLDFECETFIADGGKPGQGYPALAAPLAVRRLIPVECERLMGFPSISEKVILNICLGDKLPESAGAASRCTTGRNNASDGDAAASKRNVPSAAEPSSTSRADPAPPADLHVLLDSERGAVEIRSAGRLIWSANTAEGSSASPLCMPPAAFARLVASTLRMSATPIPDGEGVSRRDTGPSTQAWSGVRSVSVSGREIARHAEGAATSGDEADRGSTSTTSPNTQSTPDAASILRTSCCSVLAAIRSFIPTAIPTGPSFSLLIEERSGWTRIAWRGAAPEECPDGPRYRAIGNAWAVNAGTYVFDRIRLVEETAARLGLDDVRRRA